MKGKEVALSEKTQVFCFVVFFFFHAECFLLSIFWRNNGVQKEKARMGL